jgi:DUF4097 and DUF4098 domain-containing protein YvlB
MQRFHRTIERQFSTGDEARLDVEARNGSVLVEGTESPDVRIVAVVEVEADSADEAERDFRAVEAGLRADGPDVRIAAPSSERTTFLLFGRGLKVDYQVSVPRRTRVQVESRNGRVEVGKVAGEVTVASRNGSVRLEKVAGPARVTGNNGRIEALACSAGVQLESHNGHVSARSIEGDLVAETHNGEVTVEHAAGNVRLRAHNGSLRYAGAVAGDLDLEVAGNGSIRLGVPPASRFELDAEAVRGDVKSDLVVHEAVVSEAPRPVVRLRTLNGSIKISALEAVS